jgi:hypothetical protein
VCVCTYDHCAQEQIPPFPFLLSPPSPPARHRDGHVEQEAADGESSKSDPHEQAAVEPDLDAVLIGVWLPEICVLLTAGFCARQR